MDSNFALYVLAAALVLVGLAGILLPVLPGLPLVYAGLFLAAWNDGFARVGGWMLALLGLLTLASLVLDFWATSKGAQRAGGSSRAVIGASLGLLVGILFGPAGMLLGPFLGALLGELSLGKPLSAATRTGLATWLGLVLGMAMKMALAVGMLAAFAVDWYWVG